MTCLVCQKVADPVRADYCLAHHRAFENVKQAFSKWAIAFGGLDVPDFLKRVQNLAGTGQKVKEITRFLSENPSRWK